MGGKVWSLHEERVFWRIIVPQSQKRIGTGPAHTKNWEELTPLMQSVMGVDAKRTYTHLGLCKSPILRPVYFANTHQVEHFFQNIEKNRVSPNAGNFVREYRQGVKSLNKSKEEERAREAQLDGQSDDAASMINVYQDTDSRGEPDHSYHPSEVTDGEYQFLDDFEDEDGAAKDGKENWPLGCFPDERVPSRSPPFPSHSPAAMADMNPGNEYTNYMSVKASPSAERLILEDARWPHDQAHATNMGSYNEVSEMQTRPSAVYSPHEGAPSKASMRRNNYRVHPYEDARPQRRDRNLTKGHDRVQFQASRGKHSCCADPGSHHSSQGYYVATELGHHAYPMEYYDHGYHGEHFQPYPGYHGHPQYAPSHPMVFYAQAPGHFYGSYGYEPRHPTPHGFRDSRGHQSPDHSSRSMTANYDSSESRDSPWSSHSGHGHGSMEGDYVSSEGYSSSGRDYDSFAPESIQGPRSSASDSQQLGSHTGSYAKSPQVPAKELERQWVATRDRELEPFETPDRRQT